MAGKPMIMIREAGQSDAASLACMINDFNIEAGNPGRMREFDVVKHCFGTSPYFRALIADEGGTPTGYVLVMCYFDTESCAWCTYVQDLFVVVSRRRQGIGRRLIAAATKLSIPAGHRALYWHVAAGNTRGRSLYAAVGSSEQTAVPVSLDRLAPSCHRGNWHPEALPSASCLAAQDFLSAAKLMSLDAGPPFAVPAPAVPHVPLA